MEAIRVIRAMRPHGLRAVLGELRYYYWTRPVGKLRPWLATKYPAWLVQDALIRATCQTVADDETVPEVPAMVVLERWSKRTRDRKPGRRLAAGSRGQAD